MSGETMDNFIWQDFCQTAHTIKVYAECCTQYTNKMRKRKRAFDWFVILVPAVGACMFPISEYVTLAAAILTTLGGTIEKILPVATQPEAELCELDNLQTDFNKFLTEFEARFHDYRLDPSVTEIQLKDFLEHKKMLLTEMVTKLDKLVRKSPNNDKLNEIASEYINSKFTLNKTSND